jgi:hypothetical protein
MNSTGIESHNSKFQPGDLVTVMNIKDHPYKNEGLQLIQKESVDQYGADVWTAYSSKGNRMVRVQTSCFNMSKAPTPTETQD